MRYLRQLSMGLFVMGCVSWAVSGGASVAAEATPPAPKGPSCELQLEVSHAYTSELQRARNHHETSLLATSAALVRERQARQVLEKNVTDLEKALAQYKTEPKK